MSEIQAELCNLFGSETRNPEPEDKIGRLLRRLGIVIGRIPVRAKVNAGENSIETSWSGSSLFEGDSSLDLHLRCGADWIGWIGRSIEPNTYNQSYRGFARALDKCREVILVFRLADRLEDLI